MALANFAYALARAGKEVLIIDCDFAAPGVTAKFDMPATPGLLEYYQKFSPQERALTQEDDTDLWQRRRDFIREHIVKPKGINGISILSAGRLEHSPYWRFYCSHSYNRLYYFTDNQIDTSKYAYQSERVAANLPSLNQRAFVTDKQLIANSREIDYLLIDAKGQIDDKGVANLLFWCDQVVHLFPQNEEGLSLFALLHLRITSYNEYNPLNRDKPIDILPVVSRVAADRIEKTFKELKSNDVNDPKTISFYIQRFYTNFNRAAPQSTDVTSNLLVLSESRDLEGREQLYLRPNSEDIKSRIKALPLTHDYIALLAKLVNLDAMSCNEDKPLNPKDVDEAEAEIAWYNLLGVDPLAHVKEQVFEKHEREGIMRNSDGEINIALRVKTLHLMLDKILSHLAGPSHENSAQQLESDKTKLVEKALFDGGYQSGTDFGQELLDKFFHKEGGAKRFLRCHERLEFWTQFDTGTGFGKISITKHESSPPEGVINKELKKFSCIILVGNSAFSSLVVDEVTRYDLKHIFLGYAQAVVNCCLEEAHFAEGEIILKEISGSDLSKYISTAEIEKISTLPNTLAYSLVSERSK